MPVQARTPRLPLIVVIPPGYGFSSAVHDDVCDPLLIHLARAFTQDGFVVLAYNGRGQGKSEGFRAGHMQYVDDLNAALAWVMKQPELTDSKRIGFLGLSVGGMSAVMGARQHQEVRSLILWGTLPRYSVAKQDRIRDVIESAWRASDRSLSQSEFFEAYDLIDPIDHVAQLSQPILFAGGLKDTTYFVRGEQAEFLAAATLSSTTMMLKVANESHKLHHSAAHFPALARIFSAWFVGSVAAGVPKAE